MKHAKRWVVISLVLLCFVAFALSAYASNSIKGAKTIDVRTDSGMNTSKASDLNEQSCCKEKNQEALSCNMPCCNDALSSSSLSEDSCDNSLGEEQKPGENDNDQEDSTNRDANQCAGRCRRYVTAIGWCVFGCTPDCRVDVPVPHCPAWP